MAIPMTSGRPEGALTFLVFGATGGTGKHFLAKVASEGHRIRALVRHPAKLSDPRPDLAVEVHTGSITDQGIDLERLCSGVGLRRGHAG